jgi:hypothetical protein
MSQARLTAVLLLGAFAAGRPFAIAPAGEPTSTAVQVAPESIAAPLPRSDPPSLQQTTPPLEVQCGAARSSSVGNVLAAERSTVQSPRHAFRTRAHRAANVHRTALGLASEEARNRDAATALEMYWAVAEAVHSRPIAAESLASADAAITDRTALAARGLEVPVEEASLEQRRLVLADALIGIDATVDALSCHVQQAAALPPGPLVPVAPGHDGEWRSGPADVDALVREGLASKPELRMLRMLLGNLDADTVDVARTMLRVAVPALGGDACKQCCRGHAAALCRKASDCEVATVARQLRQLLRDRESSVAADIRRAARLGEAEADRAGNATRRFEVAMRTLADRRDEQSAGAGDVFAIRLAEADVAKERRAIIERLAAWERFRVQVWQAQGVLAARCGFGCR